MHAEKLDRPEFNSEKLSLGTKLAYGSGDLGTAITAALRAFFHFIFLTDVARLTPGAAGSILLIIRVWDAVNGKSKQILSRWSLAVFTSVVVTSMRGMSRWNVKVVSMLIVAFPTRFFL